MGSRVIKEHAIVRLTAVVNDQEGTFPVGTTGAVVSVYNGGQAFAVEVVDGLKKPAVITVLAAQVEVVPCTPAPMEKWGSRDFAHSKETPMGDNRKVRWAQPVYCAGVGSWYVRIGGRHGEDPMFKCRCEAHAKALSMNLNETLTRLASGRRKNHARQEKQLVERHRDRRRPYKRKGAGANSSPS